MVPARICMMLVFFSINALANPVAEWQDWKKQTFKKDLESPTSFLNAYALAQGRKGETLYLVVGDSKKQTQWLKNKPKKFYGEAEHIGDKIRLKLHDKTIKYLDSSKNNRRYEFTLSNGVIVRLVYGRRNSKMWAYLFDPEQIKQFTGFRFYDYNPKAVVKGTFKKLKTKLVGHKTVQGDPAKVWKVGNVSFKINGKETYLSAYSWEKGVDFPSRFALIYVDETAGKETYGGGRELMIELDRPVKNGQVFDVNFNKTVNFYCAHSPFWHCPVGLQEPLKVSLKAGEMLPLRKVVSK